MKFAVAKINDMNPGEIKEITVNGKKLLLCCMKDSTYKVLSALCPHEGARMVGARTLEGTTLSPCVGEIEFGRCNEIIRCPWHGYEFDVSTGKTLFESKNMNLKSYEVNIDGEEIFVEV
ncbi:MULTISPECIES: Rieske 2Fe-2S domain-containing protein [unclassified Bacillus (in: firmicutes)]|uniref:Rieske (2Fe-2S) protein n=1 Tax=unclassified Bacillus (in: firmicutes) TaxID=185979 RepID=UPI000BEF1B1E|nr:MULTISPECIES: Rieske 2Fe-2S domain-containing protein [unclassified Bacillus (in: firmicutes)]PEJ57630.1 2Fe-2S ferredoxin [Bacillus sp. AFS002410]PEL08399.1 2Fe-2S ferredoxin [Bacillus sp. AFS017336]